MFDALTYNIPTHTKANIHAIIIPVFLCHHVFFWRKVVSRKLYSYLQISERILLPTFDCMVNKHRKKTADAFKHTQSSLTDINCCCCFCRMIADISWKKNIHHLHVLYDFLNDMWSCGFQLSHLKACKIY